MKFVLYIDYLTGCTAGWSDPNGYKYIDMKAKSLEEAVEEADKIWYSERDKIYLVRIMKKTGNDVVESEFGKYRSDLYEAILCKRTVWHRNTEKNGERKHAVTKNWFLDYRKELSRAGSRTAQRMAGSRDLWQRLHTPDPELYENSMDLPEEEICKFLEFNFHWHTKECLPESEIFTDELVDSFIRRASTAFAVFLRDFFPECYKARCATFPPIRGI